MKYCPFLASIALLGIFSMSAIQISEECDGTALKAELKRELRPDYKYDSSKTSRFSYTSKTQIKEIEVPLFMGEKYNFLFNTTSVPKDVKVEIFNKPAGHKKRKLLYTLNKAEGKNIYSFEPQRSRKMYIDYTIPSHINSEMNGCLVFVLGYKLVALKAFH